MGERTPEELAEDYERSEALLADYRKLGPMRMTPARRALIDKAINRPVSPLTDTPPKA